MRRPQIQQQIHHVEERQRREQGTRRREAQQDIGIAAALAPLSSMVDCADATIVSIPSGHRPIIGAPAERLERYRAHLQTVIAEAQTAKLDASGDNAAAALAACEQRLEGRPDLQARSDTICAHCAGGCCHQAGDHAYLTVATIRRQFDDETDLSPQVLLGRYLDHLPERIVENACINHTASGCALPRSMRSDTCNAFYCDGLQAYQEAAIEQDSLPAVLLIQRDHRQWRRYEADYNPLRSIVLIDGERALAILPPPG